MRLAEVILEHEKEAINRRFKELEERKHITIYRY